MQRLKTAVNPGSKRWNSVSWGAPCTLKCYQIPWGCVRERRRFHQASLANRAARMGLNFHGSIDFVRSAVKNSNSAQAQDWFRELLGFLQNNPGPTRRRFNLLRSGIFDLLFLQRKENRVRDPLPGPEGQHKIIFALKRRLFPGARRR